MKISASTSTSLLLHSNGYTEVTETFLRFQTQECILRVNKSKITSENTFIGDRFKIGNNHGSGKVEKALL